MLQQQLGAMQINRIIEYTSSEYVRTSFFPETTPDDWVQHETWMKPHAMDAAPTARLHLVRRITTSLWIPVSETTNPARVGPTGTCKRAARCPPTWLPLGYNRSRLGDRKFKRSFGGG